MRRAESAQAHLVAVLAAVDGGDFTTGHGPAAFAASALAAGCEAVPAGVSR
ncbi:hypothetical protein [Streptomyces sp. NPDC001135]